MLGVVAVVVSVISLWLWCQYCVVGFFVPGCFLLFLVSLVGFLSIKLMIARRVGWFLSCFSSWLLCLRLFLVVSSVFGGLSVDKSNDSSTSWLVLVVLCLVCVVVAGMF